MVTKNRVYYDRYVTEISNFEAAHAIGFDRAMDHVAVSVLLKILFVLELPE